MKLTLGAVTSLLFVITLMSGGMVSAASTGTLYAMGSSAVAGLTYST